MDRWCSCESRGSLTPIELRLAPLEGVANCRSLPDPELEPRPKLSLCRLKSGGDLLHSMRLGAGSGAGSQHQEHNHPVLLLLFLNQVKKEQRG